jgi:hypothetical protein
LKGSSRARKFQPSCATFGLYPEAAFMGNLKEISGLGKSSGEVIGAHARGPIKYHPDEVKNGRHRTFI